MSIHVTDPGGEDCAENCPGCFALTISNLEADLEDERATVQALIAERDAFADRVLELEAHRKHVLKHFIASALDGTGGA